MNRGRARRILSQNPSEIVIGVFEGGKDVPHKVIREIAPDGFPVDLLPHLADFMARGFNAAYADEGLDPSDFMSSPRGRRSHPAIEQRGLQAAKLRKEGYTYGEITIRLCPERPQEGHRCNKKCVDRIRQEAKFYELKQDLERLARGET